MTLNVTDENNFILYFFYDCITFRLEMTTKMQKNQLFVIFFFKNTIFRIFTIYFGTKILLTLKLYLFKMHSFYFFKTVDINDIVA